MIRPLRRIATLVVASLLASSFAVAANATSDAATAHSSTSTTHASAQQADRPMTIPALQEWTPGTTSYEFTGQTRIVLDAAHSEKWGSTGEVVADDIEALTSGRIRPEVVVADESDATSGDLFLTLGATDERLGEQGYRMEVGSTLRIEAGTVQGAFNGTRSVLQLLRQSFTIPGGTATDWPRHPMRGILVDNVGADYSMTWWRNLIRDLSYLKLNELTLYVGFEGGPTDQEIEQLVTIASRYHVNITPQINLPGHAQGLLERYPDYALDPNGPTPASWAFDFTKPGALDIIRKEVEKYIDKFPGAYWHTGGDEYLAFPGGEPRWQDYPQFAQFAREKTGNPNATGADAYDWFMNWMDDLVASHGKKLRIWNDQLESTGVVDLHSDIVVEHWIQPDGNPDAMTVQELIDNGNKVLNTHIDRLYYDRGWRHLDAREVYEDFDLYTMHGNPRVAEEDRDQVIGARFQVWMGTGHPDYRAESVDEVAGRLYEPLRSLAQDVWGSPKIHPEYGESGTGFHNLIYALGRAPGYRVAPATSGSGSGPGVAYELNGELGYALSRSDGTVQHGVQSEPGFGPWRCETFPTDVLHDIASDPALVRYPDGTAGLLAVREDGTLVQAYQQVPGSGPWSYRTLDANVAGRPAVLIDKDGDLTMTARLPDGQLLFGREKYPGGPWSFSEIGSGAAGRPSMALDANDQIMIFARNSGGRILHLWQREPGVDDWVTETIGQQGVAGDPIAVNDNEGRLAYFVRTTDGRIQHGRQASSGDGPWTYAEIGSNVVGDPAALLGHDGQLVYFARTADGRLQHGWENSAGSQTWTIEHIASGISGDPSAANDISGRMTYYVRAEGGGLLHGWQTKPGDPPWDSTTLSLTC